MSESPKLILTITGPSTAGKTVLSKMLEDKGFAALVSTTTRPIRKGETDGIDYHFLSKDDFKHKLANGEFIEYVEFDDNAYGICSAEAKKAFDNGKPAILVAEPHGSEQIHTYCQAHGWTSVRVFVNNPIPVLLSRLLRRFAYDADATKNTDAEVADELTPVINAMRDRVTQELANVGVDDLENAIKNQLRAFSQAIEVGVDQEKLDKLVNTHGRRIGKILGQEQEEWVKPAYAENSPYDLVIDTFNTANRDEVVQQVLEVASQPGLRDHPKPRGMRA